MGSVTKRPNGAWRARVRVGPREVARHFARKVDAERWVVAQEAALHSGEWVDPRRAAITVREYGEAWRQAQAHRPSSAALVESHLRLHVYPALGHRQLGQLRRSELQAWVAGLRSTLSPATAEVVARIMGSLLRAAAADRLIPSSPMVGVRVPAPERPPVRPLTPEQVGAIMDAISPRWRAAVALGAGCGLRSGEVLGLGPDEVDWMRRRVRVTRQLVTPASPGAEVALGPPKTRSSAREVPLPHPVALELSAHLERYGTTELGGVPLFFSTRTGRPARRQALTAAMRRATAEAGLEGVTFHDLRHHYASLLIASGLSVKAIQAALGHATAAETLDTYGHLWPAEEDAMAAAVEAAWNAKRPPGAALQGA